MFDVRTPIAQPEADPPPHGAGFLIPALPQRPRQTNVLRRPCSEVLAVLLLLCLLPRLERYGVRFQAK
jgi:hypothetical protein